MNENPNEETHNNEIERAYKLELIQTVDNQFKPCPRFSFCVAGYANYMYVWGGRFSREHFKVVENSLHRLNLDTYAWETIDSSNTPESRTGATAVVHNDSIWIFGGYHSKYTNTLVRYDLREEKWVKETTKNEPPRRWHYSIVKHGSYLWLFGGTMDRTHFFDFHKFHFETLTWSEVETVQAEPDKWPAELPKILHKQGHKVIHQPRARRRHTAVVWDGAMWVIGGREESSLPSDILRFDFKAKIWTRVDSPSHLSGCKIPSAADHSAWLDERRGQLFIFGAKDVNIVVYNFETNTVVPVSARNWNRSALHKITTHHGDVVYYKNALYFFGGQTKEKDICNDMYKFSLEAHPGYKVRMNSLLNNSVLSDVVFECQGELIHAHRAILYSHSEYFRSMFAGKWKESQNSALTIKVDECSKEVFLAVLRFLYTDELWTPSTLKESLDMLKVADLYGVEVLKIHCVKLLEKRVAEPDAFKNKQDAVVLIKAADQFKLVGLQDLCLDFIVKNLRYYVDNKLLTNGEISADITTMILTKVADRIDPKPPIKSGSYKKMRRESPTLSDHSDQMAG